MDQPLTSKMHEIIIWMDRYADALLKDQYDITYSWFHLLIVLLQNEPINQRQLAKFMGHTEPAISRLLPKLIERGYISSSIDPNHKRINILSLTNEGRDLVMRANENLDAEFSEFIKASNINIETYEKLTDKISESISGVTYDSYKNR